MFPKVTLVLGGASSGKSAFAENLVISTGKTAIYLATGEAGDAEMADRIARHQRARGDGWRTVEVALDVAGELEKLSADSAVLLDCATLWLSNHMLAESDVLAEQSRLLAALERCAAPVVVVSNEVGLGGVAATTLARQFAQGQGALNIAIAARADTVVLITAGLPQVLKGALPT